MFEKPRCSKCDVRFKWECHSSDGEEIDSLTLVCPNCGRREFIGSDGSRRVWIVC